MPPAGDPSRRSRPRDETPNTMRSPIPILLPVSEIQKQTRLVNQLLAPKALLRPMQLIGRSILDVGGFLKTTILRASTALNAVLEPVALIIGLIGDMLVLALLPHLTTFFTKMGRDAREFVAGIRSAGGDTTKISEATAKFVGGFALNLAELAIGVGNLIRDILKAPGFMDALVRVITLFALLGVNTLVKVASAILRGLTSALRGTELAIEATPDAYADVTDPILRDRLMELDRSIAQEARQVGPNMMQFIVSALEFVFQVGKTVWTFFTELLKQFFPLLGRTLSGQNFRSGWDVVTGGMSKWDWMSSVHPLGWANKNTFQRRLVGKWSASRRG